MEITLSRMVTALIILSIVIIIALFAAIAVYAYLLLQRDRELKVEKKQLDKKMAAFLTDAEKQAEKILSQATSQAEALLKDIGRVKADIAKDLEAAYQDLVKDHQKEVQKMFKTFETQNLTLVDKTGNDFQAMAQELVRQLKHQGEQTLKVFAEKMEVEIKQAHLSVEKQVEADYEAAKKEVAAFKQQEMDTIKQAVERMVTAVSQEVLSKTISVDEHEKLVLEALDKAKKSNLFDYGSKHV